MVLGLPESHQIELLQAAEDNHWSTERLEREAAKVRSMLEVRRGRTASPPLVKAVRKLLRTWRSVEDAIGDDASPELSSSEIQSLYRAVDEVRGRLELLSRRLVNKGRDPLPATTPRSVGNGRT
jgi:hypothetical protein